MRFCIVGTGRCGSTLLQSMMNLHTELFVFPETHRIPTNFEYFGMAPVETVMLLDIVKSTNPSGPFEVARQDGRWIRVYEQRLTNDGIILIISDITKSKRVDQALLESEARLLRAVFDNTPVCLNLKDTEGYYLLVNKHQEEWLG